jgi:MFS family permease
VTGFLARARLRGPLWHNRDFLNFWAAHTVSQFGSQITGLALPLVAILVLDASAFQVATLGVLEFLPWVLLSLPAGVWVDRLPRRPILVAADWGRAAVLTSVPVAYLLDVLTLGQLYLVGFVAGTLTVFFDVSYQSYLPSLVEREQLQEGNSKLEVSRSAALVGGPGLGGVLVSALAAPYAILADAASFVASALFLFRIRRREASTKASATERPSMRAEIAHGMRFVIRHPLLRPYMLFVATGNFFMTLLSSVFLVFAVRDLDLTPGTIGLILSLGNIGSVVGALSATRVARKLGIGTALIVVAAAGHFSLILIPLASGASAIPLLVISQLLVGFYILNWYVNAISLIQAITPDHLLGRTNASRRFVVWSVIPFGGLAGGALASIVGLREAIWVGAIGASAAILWLLFSPVRSIRTTDDAEELSRAVNEEFAPAI